MKIAIGYKTKNSSWGGGNQFVSSLVSEGLKKGHQITFDLVDRDIDLILIIDPRSYNDDIPFGSYEIFRYLFCVNKNTLVVHRINECDERKKTKHINLFLRLVNYFADCTVFISEWLKTLNVYQRDNLTRVILNGANEEYFNDNNHKPWDKKETLKIVTHHWSPNLMKGFDVYKDLDDLLCTDEWINKIEFTYIGNLPNGFKFKKTKHIKPKAGEALGNELSKHHLYLSASINEPAGMHHIEGILCGLPIIYRESGALPEYCNGFGISFKNKDFIPALKEMIFNYEKYKKNIYKYPNNSIKMTNEYFSLFNELISNRDSILKKRNLFRSPLTLINNSIFFILSIKNVVKYFNKLIRRLIF